MKQGRGPPGVKPSPLGDREFFLPGHPEASFHGAQTSHEGGLVDLVPLSLGRAVGMARLFPNSLMGPGRSLRLTLHCAK